ncbi:MAG: amidohydrolase [Bacteroidota bacterium]
MSELKLALVQADLIWENASRNRDKFERLLAGLSPGTDIVVLPEMFSTGFSMEPQRLAEPMDGPTITWMREKAATLGAVITGSVIIEEGGKYFNRLLWITPDGELEQYNKRHLFTLAGEEKVYTAGTEQLVLTYRDWKIMPLVCYDLRFPVWSRNQFQYDLLLYVANFPDKRGFAWRTLLQARAIENQSYTIGLNRVGTDGNGIYYAGDSMLVNYDGSIKTHLPPREMVQEVVIMRAPQDTFRQKLAFLPDQDQFSIK